MLVKKTDNKLPIEIVKSLSTKYSPRVLKVVSEKTPIRDLTVLKTDVVSFSDVKRLRPDFAEYLEERLEGPPANIPGTIVRENEKEIFLPFRGPEDKRRFLIGQKIIKVATVYGARGEINNEVIKSCVNIVDSFYSFLSVDEIEFAFEAAAGGLFEANIAMYHGAINAEYVSRVLLAYKEYRKKIKVDIYNAELEIEKREQREKKLAIAPSKSATLRKSVDMLIDLYRKITTEEAPTLNIWTKIHFNALKKLRVTVYVFNEYTRAMSLARTMVKSQIKEEGSALNRASVVTRGNLEKLEVGELDDRIRVEAERILVREFLDLCYSELLTVDEFEALLLDRFEAVKNYL